MAMYAFNNDTEIYIFFIFGGVALNETDLLTRPYFVLLDEAVWVLLTRLH